VDSPPLHILFAAHDDRSSLRTKHVLDALGYHVTVRTSSGGVLATFREHPEIWDLAIFDHSVSNMSGFDLEDVIHMIRPELSTLVLPPYGETPPQRFIADAVGSKNQTEVTGEEEGSWNGS
jgi:CheY-like chemotaxis protein